MHNDVSSKDIQKEIYPHKEIRGDHQQRSKSFDPWKEAVLEKVKKYEPFQKEKVLEVVKDLMEMGREHGGWLKHMSPKDVKSFLKRVESMEDG